MDDDFLALVMTLPYGINIATVKFVENGTITVMVQ